MREWTVAYVADTSLQLTMREMRGLFTDRRTLLILAAIVGVLGLSGPFGTFELPVGPRIAYWAAIGAATFATGSFFSTWTMHALAHKQMPLALRVLVAGLSAGIPVAALVIAVNLLAFPSYGMEPLALLSIAVYSIVISLVVSLVFGLTEAKTPGAVVTAAQSAATTDAEPPRPRLLDRLPVQTRGALISISVSDHYVDVVTSRGSALVLMRLGDAISEADGVPGLQIHRSHWVALGGVKSVRRENGKPVVETTAGKTLPISRTYLPEAKAAGLIV